MKAWQRRAVAAVVVLVVLGVRSPISVQADVKLPAVISDHMVLQRDAECPIWGWADAGEKVTVTLAKQRKQTAADADGKWMVKLGPLDAGGPDTLVVEGKNRIEIKDVLVGEVWLGSGQSNMAMTVSRAKDFEQEQAAADLPKIRMFIERSGPSETPEEVGSGQWTICSPDTVGGFSATLFFFGREVYRSQQVPVGLINSSVGGTPIESWIDVAAQKASDGLTGFFEMVSTQNKAFDEEAVKAAYERAVERWKARAKQAKLEGKPIPIKPRDPIATRKKKGNIGGLFNGKIVPLIPYRIRGAIWYQGEANSVPQKASYYHEHLSLLVQDWRKRWGYEFPYAWVQLPNYNGPGRDWPTVREEMAQTLELPNTGMAITIDIGDAQDIHPKDKQDVGKRLGMWARGAVYGEDVAVSGPLYAKQKIGKGKIVLSFKHTDGGLVAKGDELTGFTIAGADRQFHPAEAHIEGETVVVSAAEVKQPVAVRYGWENNPQCNLFNKAGLPASPFRTDDFPPAQTEEK